MTQTPPILLIVSVVFLYSLQIIPADFIGFQVQIEAVVVGLDSGILGNVGVVNYVVLSVSSERISVLLFKT